MCIINFRIWQDICLTKVFKMATRANQRERTRQAIVDAAVDLHDRGESSPTMEAIAEHARVSRATVYRYFDSGADALWQGLVDRDIPSVEESIGQLGPDVLERVLCAEDVNNSLLLGDPDGARAVERTTLDRVLAGRAMEGERYARRLRYIDAALEPIADDLGPELTKVRNALALTMGSHVVGALIDTCRLDVDSAREACRFAASAIVEAALRLAEPADDQD
jgi:AcrR family transcriptional regulator